MDGSTIHAGGSFSAIGAETRAALAALDATAGGRLAASGTLTLNGPGIFVFQVNSTLTANAGSNVIGSASPCNVFWRVGTSATLNGSSFLGTVIADANITVGSGSNVNGRVMAGTGPTGAVTMAGAGGNSVGGCASAAAPGVGPGGMAILLVLLSGAGLSVMLYGRRRDQGVARAAAGTRS